VDTTTAHVTELLEEARSANGNGRVPSTTESGLPA
jgi:hypothetical protein